MRKVSRQPRALQVASESGEETAAGLLFHGVINAELWATTHVGNQRTASHFSNSSRGSLLPGRRRRRKQPQRQRIVVEARAPAPGVFCRGAQVTRAEHVHGIPGAVVVGHISPLPQLWLRNGAKAATWAAEGPQCGQESRSDNSAVIQS